MALASAPTLPELLQRLGRCAFSRHGTIDVVAAMYEMGAMALPVVVLVSCFVGTNVTLSGWAVFGQFGRGSDVGVFVALAGVREMVPVAACFMLAAKSGAGLAALIGTMRLGGQLAALEGMGVDPLRHLALPRLIAAVISCPLLVAIGNAVCLASGFVVATLQLHVDAGLYWETVAANVRLYDLGVGLFKGAAFGVVIAVASLYHGFRAEASPAGIGRASNHAVVSSSIVNILANTAITQLCYRP